MEFSSKLIEEAVAAFNSLPGIGKKTALRLVLHLINNDKNITLNLSESLKNMRENISFCPHCYNISDGGLCNICADPARKKEIVCLVENIRDVISIESTGQFHGLYYVLGGLLSPLNGIGPDKLNIDLLVERAKKGEFQELIMALNPNIEGDTTVYFIAKKLKDTSIKITSIARGVSFGGELEYADELTLARAIDKRLPVDTYVTLKDK